MNKTVIVTGGSRGIGAAIASSLLVILGMFFSYFIDMSSKYTLVYGSLAALILLMFWLYISCMVILIGADINVAYRNVRLSKFDINDN